MKKLPELLSPAGNPEKLRFAVCYGADAVYCALDRFGLRAAADNFTAEQLAQSAAYAHERGVKVYVTLNTMPDDAQLRLLPGYVSVLREAGADALIISDIGVAETVRKTWPDAVLHLSTQASAVNSAACRFWHEYGFSRIVLARELTLEQIKEIRSLTPPSLELEAFVHGAMCIAYSGRCLLSAYCTGRSANDGRCAQPCRWKFYVSEEKGETGALPAEQDKAGSYLFSSKDLCMIEHVGELAEAGIDSFKIEGRVKSAYYTAAVTNAYRLAIADWAAGRPFDPACLAEVESVSHREYGTGFYFAPPSEIAQTVSANEYIKDKAFLCTVSSFDPGTHLARCIQRNKVCAGTKARLLSPGRTGRDITVDELFDAEMNPIESAPHPRQEFYIRIDEAKENDIIRAI